MKVVQVFKDYYPPTTGGIEQHMHLLCSALAREADVSVLVPSRARRTVVERLNGVHVVRAAEFGRYVSAPLCPTMPLWLWRLRPDILHLHFPNPMGDLTYLVSGWRGPLVVTYHSDIIKQQRFLPFYRPVLKLLFDRVDRIIATSEEYIASSEWLTRYRHKCRVVPSCPDPARITLRDGEREMARDIRAQYGNRLVLFVGVLRYYKGLDVLVRAMTRVNARALIVGRGEERERLRALAAELGIAERVVLLDEVPEPQLRALLHAADVFVLPSIDRCEALGLAALEAMACGTPVVSTDLPSGVRFVNQHEVTGLRVPPRDPDALAAALTRLLDDAGLRARYGEAARQRVEGHFGAGRMVTQVLEIYADVLRRRAAAVRTARAV